MKLIIPAEITLEQLAQLDQGQLAAWLWASEESARAWQADAMKMRRLVCISRFLQH